MKLSSFLFIFLCSSNIVLAIPPVKTPILHYKVSMPDASQHYFNVELKCSGWTEDTIELKMPNWMPGYYQLMDYAKSVESLSYTEYGCKSRLISKSSENSWRIPITKNKPFTIRYKVKTTRQFVANNFVDSTHAYIVSAALFMYIKDHIEYPVTVQVLPPTQWKDVATGLEAVVGKPFTYKAPDFDILYDCPILIGNLEELPAFTVKGVRHRFIGYRMGDFDKPLFMANLKKVVEAAVTIMQDIPYKEYTFIGIGPGQGGIEHLNNTTVSFTGKGLDTKGGMNRMMNFLAHEYFHHYNIKRIRPFELGPFNYDKANRTNLLWVSEGLSVYYEYLIVKRAGLTDENTLLADFEGNINALENNPGRFHQSLQQASYETWSDGPFGRQGEEANKSISYYDKGPIVGLLLDITIRKSSSNKNSLDDVFRYLYRHYYQYFHRGFTEAEFQEACEIAAGTSLSNFFEYVYTTKELDYTTILKYAGLRLEFDNDKVTGKKKARLVRDEKASEEEKGLWEGLLK